MKTYKNRSLILHILVLCTFIFPFYFTGCKKVEDAANTAPDSTSILSNDTLPTRDSSTVAGPMAKDTVSPPDTAQLSATNSEHEEPNTAQKICKKYPSLSPILISKDFTYSGLAVLINVFENFPLFSIAFTVFLLLFSLVLKIINTARPVALMHTLLALIFLLLAQPVAFSYEILWGYWLCVGLLTLVVGYDGYLIKTKKD